MEDEFAESMRRLLAASHGPTGATHPGPMATDAEASQRCHTAPNRTGERRTWNGACTVGNVLTARVILFGLVVFQLADALTFTIGVSRFGIGLESNGIAATIYHLAGLNGVLALKAGVTLAAIAILVATADIFPRLLVWGGAAGTAIGLLGFVSNSASILLLS